MRLTTFAAFSCALFVASGILADASAADPKTGAPPIYEQRYNAGDYPAAAELARQRLASLRAARPVDSAAIAQALIDYGCALREYADLAEAEDPLRDAVAIERGRVTGPHAALARALHEQARCAEWRGEPDRADTLATEALAVRDAIAPADSVAIARLFELLSTIRNSQSRDEESESLSRKAIDIQDRYLGDHLDTSTSLVSLRRILTKADRIQESIYALRRAVVIRRTLSGSEHPLTAEAQKWLAISYNKRGDYAKAETLLRESLAANRRVFGNEHDVVLSVLGNLALPLVATGKHEEALDVYLECARIHEVHDQENFQVVLRLYGNIAREYQFLGRYAEAEKTLLGALDRAKSLGLENHQNATTLHQQLASTYFKQGRLDEAKVEAQLVRDVLTKRLGEAHRDVVAIHSLLGQIDLERGNLAEAKKNFERAARSYELVRIHMGAGVAASTFQTPPYEPLAAIELELGEERAAWEAIERTRGRALGEMAQMTQASTLWSRTGVVPKHCEESFSPRSTRSMRRAAPATMSPPPRMRSFSPRTSGKNSKAIWRSAAS